MAGVIVHIAHIQLHRASTVSERCQERQLQISGRIIAGRAATIRELLVRSKLYTRASATDVAIKDILNRTGGGRAGESGQDTTSSRKDIPVADGASVRVKNERSSGYAIVESCIGKH